MDGPPLPEGFEYIWDWFKELDAARGSNGFGPAALSFVEIDAWARLTLRHPSPWDVAVLKILDVTYLNAMAKAAPKKPAASGSSRPKKEKG